MNISQLIALCKDKSYLYRVQGDNPNIVLVGEKHELEDLPIQEAIIEIVSPKIILHEGADREYSDRPETQQILNWGKKYGVPVTLLDIPLGIKRGPVLNKKSLSDRFGDLFSEFDIPRDLSLLHSLTGPIRESHMYEIIEQRVQSKKTPLVAVVGAGHAMPNSSLQENMRNSGLEYMTIIQDPVAEQIIKDYTDFFKK